ncbi:MAG: 3-deoxy-7-phosphoheptulonate synthase [Deltaproteobacteria bacterium]|nr:3-deoxy-7-phosphoheptulonate synthase [Deltaproteobacteria bacterium]
MRTAPENWRPDSWKAFTAAQQPLYDDPAHVQEVIRRIRSWPPLVYPGEVKQLRRELALASERRRFILQGGDCAEKFSDCNRESITAKLKILLQMSVILCYASKRPIIKIGRIAGQYGKPRSNLTEEVRGCQIHSYRGDNINAFEPDAEARKPDPERLAQGQQIAAMTLNYIRALSAGGFADLHHPDHWNLNFLSRAPHREQYEATISSIHKAIGFVESIGYRDASSSKIDFYTSHEGLILALEEAMTSLHTDGAYYNHGAHMLWIGDRTRQVNGAHAEYFRGIENPVGIKVGPSSSPEEISELIHIINPSNEAGRIMLITRFGCEAVQDFLPAMIEQISSARQKVCWSCDPMHGNIIKTKNGIKTRDFNAILAELKRTFEIHKQLRSYLGAVHFELTGEDVTECTGGAEGITDQDLSTNYESFCDPRLNYSQSLEMAFLIAQML